MDGPARVPPRFVPTLTAVVDPQRPDDAPPAVQQEAPPPPPAEPASAPVETAAPASMVALDDADAFRLEEELLHRVLQRIDLSLEERLTEVVSAAVQRQLDAMVPQLRGEIEAVLRALVIEALARELPGNTESQTRS
ncbi:hypothetical protein [Xenophilus sp.]|uniref:hypothetical protein n=1 Tax=Xenophilus sp. TaxID=1873499 RepID=UPI0037DC9D05